jgi:hypothetical protein
VVGNPKSGIPSASEAGIAGYAGLLYGGANNSASDPSCLSTSNFLHLGAAHLPRILQLGMKFIF